MGSKVTTRGGSSSLSFAGLLTILFICLKLTGHITWSWVWVLCPLWIGFAFIAVVAIIALAVWGVATLLDR